MASLNLDNVMVVGTDGSCFSLSIAYLIDLDALTPDQLDLLNTGSDSDLADLCSEVGVGLEKLVKEASL